MATQLPPGWALDYDGDRWLFRHDTGLTQYRFPTEADAPLKCAVAELPAHPIEMPADTAPVEMDATPAPARPADSDWRQTWQPTTGGGALVIAPADERRAKAAANRISLAPVPSVLKPPAYRKNRHSVMGPAADPTTATTTTTITAHAATTTMAAAPAAPSTDLTKVPSVLKPARPASMFPGGAGGMQIPRRPLGVAQWQTGPNGSTAPTPSQQYVPYTPGRQDPAPLNGAAPVNATPSAVSRQRGSSLVSLPNSSDGVEEPFTPSPDRQSPPRTRRSSLRHSETVDRPADSYFPRFDDAPGDDPRLLGSIEERDEEAARRSLVIQPLAIRRPASAVPQSSGGALPHPLRHHPVQVEGSGPAGDVAPGLAPPPARPRAVSAASSVAPAAAQKERPLLTVDTSFAQERSASVPPGVPSALVPASLVREGRKLGKWVKGATIDKLPGQGVKRARPASCQPGTGF